MGPLENLPTFTISGFYMDGTPIYDRSKEFAVKKIIYCDPATIIYWEDGTKTVVKCQEGDTYDPEKGIAMCFMKKALGNKGNFNNTLNELVKQDKEL